MIPKDSLEDQLLNGLTSRILQPAMVDFALGAFQEQLQQRLRQLKEQAESASDGIVALQAKRQDLKVRVSNVTEAIASFGHSPSLLNQLASLEGEISKLDDRLAEMNQPHDFALSIEDLRQYLYRQATEISALLHGDVDSARQALPKYVERLVLTPKSTPEGPLLEVSGNVEIFQRKRGWGGCVYQ